MKLFAYSGIGDGGTFEVNWHEKKFVRTGRDAEVEVADSGTEDRLGEASVGQFEVTVESSAKEEFVLNSNPTDVVELSTLNSVATSTTPASATGTSLQPTTTCAECTNPTATSCTNQLAEHTPDPRKRPAYAPCIMTGDLLTDVKILRRTRVTCTPRQRPAAAARQAAPVVATAGG